MAGMSKWAKKAQTLANNEKVKRTIKSPKVQDFCVKGIWRASAAVDKATNGKHSDKIRRARTAAEKQLRNRSNGSGNTP